MTIPAQYQAIAAQAAQAYGLPIQILDMVISHESSWNPTAVGDQGTSFGLAQIHLPAHGDVSQEQANNPTYAIFWTAKELGAAYKQYNGDMAATIIHHNSPVAADYYARTGQFGPNNALSQASQSYLSAVLQPLGGVKGVRFAANNALSTTPTTPTQAAGGPTIDLNPVDKPAATTPPKPVDSTVEFANAIRQMFGGGTMPVAGTSASTSGASTGSGLSPSGNTETVTGK